jgi:hypothetical protein
MKILDHHWDTSNNTIREAVGPSQVLELDVQHLGMSLHPQIANDVLCCSA